MSGLIISVGTSRYLIGAKCPLVLINEDSDQPTMQAQQVPTPATLIFAKGIDLITSSWLKTTIDTMIEVDDVFCKDFLLNIVVLVSTEGACPPCKDDIEILFEQWGTTGFSIIYLDPSNMLHSGPYFLLGSDVHQVSKLYPDPYGAFMYGVTQSEDDITRYDRVGTDLIPVPSRLYFAQPSEAQPLSGKRLAIKDIYDIRGLKTSMCCKSYEACYGESNQTARAIQLLLTLGAVIVAKAKTVQLASGLGPRDWIDYQCPFNPRGDGYLDPDCSSTGSAAAVAAYDWLDFSIGSDSLGSMVGPAAANGIFGLRPTHGRLPLDGSLLVSTLLDTPGLFVRNISDFATCTNAWLGTQSAQTTMPHMKILFPAERFLPYPQAKLDVMESFVKDIERTVGTERAMFDINNLWKEMVPLDTLKWKSIDDFLGTTLAHIQLYDSYHNNARFRSEHEAEYGFSPYVEPMIQYKWDLGAKLSRSDYNQACNEKAKFQLFLRDFVFKIPAVLLLPGGNPETSYRDEYLGSPKELGEMYQGYGFKNIAFSALGGCPCISFPVGQSSYRSKVTTKEAFEPVSLWLVGPAGSDSYLVDLVKRVLESSGRPLSVKVGKTAF